MTRLDRFYALAGHPWLGAIFARLSQAEVNTCLQVLRQHEAMDKAQFEELVNRMWLDRTDKPRHHAEMAELLLCANSAKEDGS